jgi:hypothetical protein
MNFEDITLQDCDFFAKQKNLIVINPNFNSEKLQLCSVKLYLQSINRHVFYLIITQGNFGPF